MATENYKSRLVDYMTGATTCLAITVAKETGLLSLFTEPHSPMTLDEISTKANLKKRYVQELLGCLVTASVIDIDETFEKYYLPVDDRQVLKSMAVSVSFVDFVTKRKEDLKSSLDPNGPNGYCTQSKEGYGEVLSARRNLDLDQLIQDEFFLNSDDLKEKFETGIKFIEFGCGEGAVVIELAKRFPNSQFFATDYSSDAVKAAADAIKSQNLKNATAMEADLYNLPSDWSSRFDVAYIRDVLHDLGDPVKGISEIVRCVKNGGIVTITDILLKGDNLLERRKQPEASQCYMFSSCICIPESLCQPGGKGLGCTSYLSTLMDILKDGGIEESELETYRLSSYNIRFLYRKK